MKNSSLFIVSVLLVTAVSVGAEISGSGHRVEGCTGVITSLVWNDANGNGVQDAGEPPLTGAVLRLSRTYEPELGVDTLITDANGSARFFNLCLRSHLLSVAPESLPPGMVATNTSTGSQELASFDSNATLAPVQIDLDEDYTAESSVDFGFHQAGCVGAIGDFVWLDENADGLQSASEQGLPGVEVQLLNAAGNQIQSAVSDAHGRYWIAGICDGSHQLVVDHAALPYVASPALQGSDATLDSDDGAGTAHVADGATKPSVDFGFYAPGCSGSIAGRIYHDADSDGSAVPGEVGIAGVVVAADVVAQSNGLTRLAVTDEAGNYRIAGLCAGAYELHVDARSVPGAGTATFDLTQPIYSTLPANDAQVVIDDLGFALACDGSIGDFVWIDTDGDGQQDADEVGLENASVVLRDHAGNVLGQRRTDTNGHYRFVGLCAADYVVQIDATTLPVGMQPTATGQGTPQLDSDGSGLVRVALASDTAAHSDADFGYVTAECSLRLTSSCGALSFASSNFECEKPISALSMTWQGAVPVRIVAYDGDSSESVLADIDNIGVGEIVRVAGYDDSPKDVVWQVYAAGSNTLMGESWFHLSCSDDDMDGPEDCGRAQGDGKNGSRCDDGCVIDWRLAGAVDKHGELQCAPEAPASGDQCDAALGQWISVRHELRSVGGTAAQNVQIDDPQAPEFHDQPVSALPSGARMSYQRAVRVNASFVATVSATAGDGLQSCADRATVTVAATPVPNCAVFGSPHLEKSKNKVKWRLTNVGDSDLTVGKMSVRWFAGHGNIKEIKLADKFVDIETPPSYAIFSDEQMVRNRSKRQFRRGKTEKLEIKFKDDAHNRTDADYQLTVDFEEGCSITFDLAGE